MKQQQITQQENPIDYHPCYANIERKIKFAVSCTALQELVELYNLLNSTACPNLHNNLQEMKNIQTCIRLCRAGKSHADDDAASSSAVSSCTPLPSPSLCPCLNPARSCGPLLASSESPPPVHRQTKELEWIEFWLVSHEPDEFSTFGCL